MIGILTEKPSQANNFAAALDGKKGTYNGEDYIIANTVGHIYTFVDPEKQVSKSLASKYHSWSIDNLPWDERDFTWKKVLVKDKAGVLSNIEAALRKCDEICIATDVEPTGEGELLAWEILDALALKPKKWSRMYFEDESVKSIQKAFVNRKELSGMATDLDYIKADYRSKWDFLSMQFTRIATCFGDGHAVLRQGRLKSAMVRITGDGLKAGKEYKKVPSYQNRYHDENGVIYTDKDEPVFPKKEDVPKKYNSSEVVLDSKTIKHTAPPKLIDLSTLASLGAPKGYDPKEMLATYQKMYEAKIVSYPRTEDKFVTPEQFNDLLPLVDDIAKVVGVDTKLLTHRTPRSTHVKTGGAHGANRPGPNVPKSLDMLVQYGKSAKFIYETLARNYLAMLAEDYEYESQKGHVKDYPSFVGTCSVPKKQGYKQIFSDVDEPDEDNGKGLGTMAKPFIYEGYPPKPPVPTMKWLMQQLEKRDVGTGATRTSIFTEVTDNSAKNKYPLMKQTKGKLTLTQYGDMSYLLLKDTHIGSLEITEQVMTNLRAIGKGNADPNECLSNVKQLVVDDIETMKRNSVAMRKELGIMETVQKAKYKGIWRHNGKETEVSFTRSWGGHEFTDEECEALLSGEEIELNDLVSKAGKTYGVKGKLELQSYNGHSYVGFQKTGFADTGDNKSDTERYSGTWNGKKVSFKRTWGGHDFTDAECEKLLNGEEITIQCTSAKTGKEYEATGKLAQQTFNGNAFVGFKRTDDTNNKGIPKEWCQHEFTEDEINLLEAGQKVQIDGCISKKGNVFACTVTFDKKANKIVPDFNK